MLCLRAKIYTEKELKQREQALIRLIIKANARKAQKAQGTADKHTQRQVKNIVK